MSEPFYNEANCNTTHNGLTNRLMVYREGHYWYPHPEERKLTDEEVREWREYCERRWGKQ